MGWGSNTKAAPATTDAYRESKLWTNIEKAKKAKAEYLKREERFIGSGEESAKELRGAIEREIIDDIIKEKKDKEECKNKSSTKSSK